MMTMTTTMLTTTTMTTMCQCLRLRTSIEQRTGRAVQVHTAGSLPLPPLPQEAPVRARHDFVLFVVDFAQFGTLEALAQSLRKMDAAYLVHGAKVAIVATSAARASLYAFSQDELVAVALPFDVPIVYAQDEADVEPPLRAVLARMEIALQAPEAHGASALLLGTLDRAMVATTEL